MTKERRRQMENSENESLDLSYAGREFQTLGAEIEKARSKLKEVGGRHSTTDYIFNVNGGPVASRPSD